MALTVGRSAIVCVGYSKFLRDKGIDRRRLAEEVESWAG
jgi:hypothetical protein